MREERFFYGLHTLGDVGPVNLDWTVNYQGGNYNGRSIDAWLVLLARELPHRQEQGRTARRLPLRLCVRRRRLWHRQAAQRARAPFGNNIYYSYQLYATPTNLIAFAPTFTFTPLAKLRVSAEYQLSWRDTVTDAVYRANGTAFAARSWSRGARSPTPRGCRRSTRCRHASA